MYELRLKHRSEVYGVVGVVGGVGALVTIMLRCAVVIWAGIQVEQRRVGPRRRAALPSVSQASSACLVCFLCEGTLRFAQLEHGRRIGLAVRLWRKANAQ